MATALLQYAEGATLQEIADQIGVPMRRLRIWLLSEVPDQYREAQARGLIARIVDVDDELDQADSPVAVNKADKKAKYARWDAERRLHRLFGPKQELSGPGGAPLLEDPEAARRLAFLLASSGTRSKPEPIDVTPSST